MSGLVLPRVVLSQAAEDAVTVVNRTFAWFTTLSAPGPGSAQPESVVLPHLLAVGEEFTRESLLECSERQVLPGLAIHESLWERGEREAEQSWESVKASWKAWHGINFASFPQYEQHQGLVEARNAVVHGLGRLTRRQTRKDGGKGTKTKLKKAKIDVVGSSIVLKFDDVQLARLVVIGLVEWLDGEMRARGLWRAVGVP
mgnify:CR=1 FL=1